MRLFYSDQDRLQLPEGHRFPAAKYPRIWQTLAVEHPTLLEHAPRAEWDEVALAHDPLYLADLERGTLSTAAVRKLGFPWSESLVNRSLRSVGGTLAALKWALIHGAAGHMAGGTHHAFADRGEGYCVLNDIAVAIHVARRHYNVGRIAVIDLDVHQGDGTASMFRADPTVFTLSLHGAKNYPFRKEQSALDVPLDDQTSDDVYLAALDAALPAVAAHKPELLFYQAGVDALAGDRLGRLALTHTGLMKRDARVYALASTLRVPLVVTLGGGYHRNIEDSVVAHANVYRCLVQALG
ncbi:MAG: histone deacetylase [Polyangiaceae bacterium]|nr:histone deacetylase [Polyangiaceae bacterium]